MRDTPYPKGPPITPEVRAVAQDLGVPELIARVLVNRGVTTREGLARLIAPPDRAGPAALPDLDRAVSILAEALRTGRHIRVHGDYDADGVTATAVLVRGLRHLGGAGARVDYHIPNRFDEGYGLSPESVERARRDGVDVLVTVDCGASSQEAAELARTLGLTLVITDHHALSWPLPTAEAVVNPERMAKPNRFSGAGVALQLTLALAAETGGAVPAALEPIAAVGTVADVVPLTGDNRALVASGLEMLRRGVPPGLKVLVEAAGRDLAHLTADDLAFYVGPRLNAAGRMGDPAPAVEVLLAPGESEAGPWVAALEEANRRRRDTERALLEAAWDEVWTLAERLGELPRFVVVGGENWHPGVIGIVAARLERALGRPVAVIGWDGGEGRGSARSAGALNLVQHLRRHDDLFLRLGGHAGAAGFSLARTPPTEISRRLSEDLAETAGGDSDGAVDGVISAADLTDETLAWLARLEPFGHGFERPRWRVRGTIGSVARVGSQGEHLRFRFRQNGLPGIWFRAEGDDPPEEMALWTVGTVEFGYWRGAVRAQWHADLVDAPPKSGEWAGRVVTGLPAGRLDEPAVFIAGSQRELRRLREDGAAAYDWTRTRGERRALVEAFNRGRVSRLAFSGWRPWPPLAGRAATVVFAAAPVPLESLGWAARFLAPGGSIRLAESSWEASARERVAAKWRRLVPAREELGRLWVALRAGKAPLWPGRAVFAELGLDPNEPPGVKRDLWESPSYRQGWAWRTAALAALAGPAPRWLEEGRDR